MDCFDDFEFGELVGAEDSQRIERISSPIKRYDICTPIPHTGYQDPWLTDEFEGLVTDFLLTVDEDEYTLRSNRDVKANVIVNRIVTICDEESIDAVPITVDALLHYQDQPNETKTLRLKGGVDPPIDAEDIIAYHDDIDETQIVFPRSVSELELPLPGLRLSVIESNKRHIERLITITKDICVSLNTTHFTWKDKCVEDISALMAEANKKYRSPEKRKIVEQELTIRWLEEWRRRLELRYDPPGEEPKDDSKVSLNRHLNGDAQVIKHAFRGANTFKNLLTVLFSPKPEDVLNAKLDLLATSDDSCHKYSRNEIYTSFIRLCQVCSITPDELIHFSATVNNTNSIKHCICGRPISDPYFWTTHQCTFERWLSQSGIARIQGNRLIPVPNVIWSDLIDHRKSERLKRSVDRGSTSSCSSHDPTQTDVT